MGTECTIIEIGDFNSRLASDIIGVRQSDGNGSKHIVWVDLATVPMTVIIDCETEQGAIEKYDSILAEWKYALAQKGKGEG